MQEKAPTFDDSAKTFGEHFGDSMSHGQPDLRSSFATDQTIDRDSITFFPTNNPRSEKSDSFKMDFDNNSTTPSQEL